jgi:HAD superfamily hydrolase (TIGR01509 family)
VRDLGAVLFDMDGTLVDSEKVWGIGLHELANRHGGVLSEAARMAMVGTATRETVVILHQDIGQPWRDPVADSDWLDARMLALFAEGLAWMPGARELLVAVRAAGVPMGLVTNTSRALVDVALRTIGRHHFDVIICGDEVARTKPDPAPYAAAVAALGVEPGACVVIEDSPTGVASAVGAGCAVVAIPHHVPVTHPSAVIRPSLLDVDLDLVRHLAGTPVGP